MSRAYGGQPKAESIAALGGAIKLGVTLLDIAELYGPYENEVPFGPSRTSANGRLVVATKSGFKIVAEKKCGSDRMMGLYGTPEKVKTVADESLKRSGIKVIDLDHLHRIDPTVPVFSRLEGTVQATDIQLSPAEMDALDVAMPPEEIVGDRHRQAGA